MAELRENPISSTESFFLMNMLLIGSLFNFFFFYICQLVPSKSSSLSGLSQNVIVLAKADV